MARGLVFSMAFSLAVTTVLSYPNGGPLTACENLMPDHKAANQMPGDYYTIATACYVILPTEFMKMRVWDDSGLGGMYKGLFIQVRDGSGSVSGVFSIPGPGNNNFHTVNCNYTASTATHSNRKLKKDSTNELVWTAPASCKQNEEFEIRATVVRKYSEWQTIRVPMVCNADYSNVAVMERVRPPQRAQYCAQGSWAIIPKGATTSFETNLARRGWRHFYGSPDLRFVRTETPTPVVATGPPAAQNGKYYLYYAGAGKKKHDMAGLMSPFGIQGCFCFSFWCHMDTDGKTEFTLSTIGAIQKLILTTKAVTPDWRRVSYSFLSSQPIVFAFQVFSSGTDDGGVGVDDIQVSAGPCDGNSVGYAGYIDLNA